MMLGMADQPRGQTVGRLAVGVGVGALLAVFASLMPVIATVSIGILIAATCLAMARGSRQLPALAGIVLGTASVLLFGAMTTYVSCSQTANFCGNANPLPLLLFGVVAAVTGAAGSVIAVRRSRP